MRVPWLETELQRKKTKQNLEDILGISPLLRNKRNKFD